MTTYYCDPGYTGTATSYNPTLRDDSGSDLAYKTIGEVYALVASNDFIICRGGTSLESSQVGGPETGVSITVAPGEHFIMEQTTADQFCFLPSGAGVSIDGMGGSITFYNPLASTTAHAALRMNAEGQWTKNVTVDASTVLLSYSIDTNVTHTDMTFQRTVGDMGARTIELITGTAAKTGYLTLNNPVFDGVGLIDAHKDANLIINNPLWLNCEEGAALAAGAGLVKTVTIRNPIAIGSLYAESSAVAAFSAANNNIEVTGGILHDTVRLPYAKPNVLSSSTASDRGIVRLSSGAQKCYVSISFWDSLGISTGIGNAGAVLDYATEFERVGKKLNYFPDDHYSVLSSYISRLDELVSRGHLLGMVGNSGGDPWSVTQPVELTYTGAGTASLVISPDGETWTLTDSTDGSSPWVIDTSFEATYQYLDPAGSGVMAFIDGLTNFSAGYKSPVASGYDDAASRGMASDTFSLTSGVSQPLTWDDVRWYTTEISEPAAYIEGLMASHTFEHFHARGGTIPTDLKTYLSGNSWKTCFGDASTGYLKQPMSEIVDAFSGKFAVETEPTLMFKGTKATFDGLATDTLRKERLRDSAERLISMGFQWGNYFNFQFEHSGTDIWTKEEMGWLLDELITAGFDIIPVSDVPALIGTNSPAGGEHVNTTGSAGLGSGAKWWGTDPRPAGRNGEPYPDTDIDAGSSQSTLSSDHPVNI